MGLLSLLADEAEVDFKGGPGCRKGCVGLVGMVSGGGMLPFLGPDGAGGSVSFGVARERELALLDDADWVNVGAGRDVVDLDALDGKATAADEDGRAGVERDRWLFVLLEVDACSDGGGGRPFLGAMSRYFLIVGVRGAMKLEQTWSLTQ